jgi:hypothetical protein
LRYLLGGLTSAPSFFNDKDAKSIFVNPHRSTTSAAAAELFDSGATWPFQTNRYPVAIMLAIMKDAADVDWNINPHISPISRFASKPMTLEELLVSTLAQGRPREASNREGCHHHPAGILAEDRGREGNIPKVAEADSAMTTENNCSSSEGYGQWTDRT